MMNLRKKLRSNPGGIFEGVCEIPAEIAGKYLEDFMENFT